MTSNNGVIRGYICTEGYIRTSSLSFNIEQLNDVYVHLTNDAVQKGCNDYGKFEAANKLTYTQFESYLKKKHPEFDFKVDIL